MYTKFYGLKEKPFEITPDPRFLFLSENHKEALSQLIYSAKEKRGFTVISGEVGTGKTILIQTLLGRLNGKYRTAYLFNPILEPTDFMHYVCEDLVGFKILKRSKGEYISQLHNLLISYYSRNINAILIIDEAQNLPYDLFEEVRMLTNLETAKNKLLQVILMGQPELDSILDRHEFRQLKQRVSLRYQLYSLNFNETRQYIIQRLKIAGAKRVDFFNHSAIKKIYKYSKGIPRVINIVCDNALFAGYGSGNKVIDGKIITQVVNNLNRPKLIEARKKKLIIFIICIILFIFLSGGIVFKLMDFNINDFYKF